MIDVSVKTLDGQNRNFSVADDMTVGGFKDKIASSINIAADQQRLIFRGRVLQDETKLNDHDVDGKVIHVVQRLPGSGPDRGNGSTPRTTTTTPSAAGHHHHHHDHFVMGSFTVPGDTVSPDGLQNIVQQALGNLGDLGRNARVTTRTHSTTDGNQMDVHINLGSVDMGAPRVESQSFNRINNARRMVQSARRKLNILQNNGTPGEDSADSVTSNSSQPGTPPGGEGSPPGASSLPSQQTASPPDNADQTPPGPPAGGQQTPGDSSGRNGASRQPGQPSTSMLADLLQDVLDLNRDFQPYLDRYHQFLRDDPPLEDDTERRDAERLCNEVPRILHSISHAYHSVSDIMVDVSRPAPRELRAPPAPTPHPTAVIQQTIPVRANIAIATPRSTPSGSPQTARRQPVFTAAPTAPPSGTNRTTTSASSTQTSGPMPAPTPNSTSTATPTPGVPAPTTTTNPLVFMEVGPSSVSIGSMQTTSSSTTNPSPPQGVQMMSGPGGPQISNDFIQNIVQGIASSVQRAAASGFPTSQPSTTPNSTTPSAPTPATATPPGVPTSTPNQTTPTPNSANVSQGMPPPGQMPQMMFAGIPGIPGGIPGLSLPPPAVDPYLPCQSRHWLVQRASSAATATPTPPVPPSSNTQNPSSLTGLVTGVMDQIMNQIPGQRPPTTGTNTTPSSTGPTAPSGGLQFLPRGTFGPMPPHGLRPQPPAPATPQTPRASAGTANTTPVGQPTPCPPGTASSLPGNTQMTDQLFAQMVQSIGSTVHHTMSGGAGPTISDFLNQFREQTPGGEAIVVHGDGFINELFSCVSIHLTFPDMMGLFWGRTEPVARLRRPLQRFIRNNILHDGMPTNVNINDAVERLVAEIQEEIVGENFNEETHDNIDYPASINNVVRNFLRTNINYILHTTDSDTDFANTVFTSCRTFFGELIVLTRCSLVNGMEGFYRLIANRMNTLGSPASAGMQAWMTDTTLGQIRGMVPNVTVTDNDIQQYIVRKAEKASCPKDSANVASNTVGSSSTENAMDKKDKKKLSDKPLANVSDGVSSSSDTAVGGATASVRKVGSEADGEDSDHGSFHSVDSEVKDEGDSGLHASVPVGSRAEAMDTSGGEDWRQVVPSEWIPVIAQDVEKMKSQTAQRPFSDAYLNGIAPKRRRLMSKDKPLNIAEASGVVSESLCRAVASSDVQPITSLDAISDDVAADSRLQAVFQEQIQRGITERLTSDPDFNPTRFEKSSEYFKAKNGK